MTHAKVQLQYWVRQLIWLFLIWFSLVLPASAQLFSPDDFYNPTFDESAVPFATARQECKSKVSALKPESEFAIWVRALISDQYKYSRKTRNNVSYISVPGSIVLRFPQHNLFATDQRHFGTDLSSTARINLRAIFDRSTKRLIRHEAWSDCTFALEPVNGKVLLAGRAKPKVKLETNITDQRTEYRMLTSASDPLIPEAMLFPVRIVARMNYAIQAPKQMEMKLEISHFPYFEILLENRDEVNLLRSIEPEKNRGPLSVVQFSTTPPRSYQFTIELPD